MNKQTKIVIACLSVVLVALLALAAYQYYHITQQDEELTQIVEVMEFEKQASIEEYEQLSREYEEFYITTNNDSLLKLIDEEKQKVKQLLQELKTVKATNARRIRQLQKELGTVRNVLKSYVEKVDSLNAVNQHLSRENRKVRKQYEDASKAVQNLEEKTAELDKKINLASILEASQIEVNTLNNKGNKTKRLSRITLFEICFQVLRNITTERGVKTLYMRIADPAGNVMTDAQSGVFDFEDNQIEYSIKKDIEYGGENTPVCMYYTIQNDLEKGVYSIAIFADGNLIGSTGFALK